MRPIALAVLILHSLAFAAMDSIESRMDTFFREYNKPNAPGASVIVLQQGKILFAKGYGLADVEARVPCTTNTNFRLASVTKQFTAMAVVMLPEPKKMSFERKPCRFFPEVPEIRHPNNLPHPL